MGAPRRIGVIPEWERPYSNGAGQPASVIDHALAETRQSVFWLDDLARGGRGRRPKLTGDRVAELAIVGGGYTGLWTAVLAKRRNPARTSCSSRRRRSAGRHPGATAASARRASRTAARTAWPAGPTSSTTLDRLGLENLDAIEAAGMPSSASTSTSSATAPSTSPSSRTSSSGCTSRRADAAARGDDTVRFLDEAAVRAEVASPTYLGAVWNTRTTAIVHPASSRPSSRRAAEELGVEIFEHSPVRRLDTPGSTGAVDASSPTTAASTPRHAVLATNVFPSLLQAQPRS